MGKKLRLAAIGIGNIFKGCHATPLLENPEVELVALCDIVADKAQAFAKANGIKHVFKDYRELLALNEVDAVDICTPNVFHSEIAIAALNAGKHVFTEKPDSINVTQAQLMADAARVSGKVLMAMRNNRFTPTAQFLKRYIAAGHMGEIYTGRCGWIRRRGIPGKGGWFTTKELSGGGPLIDLGVHFIDLATWLMGNPTPAAVVGSTYRKFADATDVSDSAHAMFGEKADGGMFDVEDLATGFIKFTNGASLQIEFSWASNVEEESSFVELRGSKSGFTFRNGELKLFTEIEGTLCDVIPKPKLPLPHAHGGMLKHFVDVILHGVQPIIQPQHGVNTMKILMALYQSADGGAEVSL
jgi:predicted dehydrogenase